MKLLSPEQTIENKKTLDESQKKRIQSMNEEESRAVLKLNTALQNFNDENLRITNELKQLKKDTSEEIEQIQKAISLRKQELSILMQPIYEIRKEAQLILEEAKQKQNDIEKSRIDLEKDRVLLAEKTNDFEREKITLSKNTALLVAREEKLIQEQADHDRHANARESRLRDEKSRLNRWFEEEDEKLKKKQRKATITKKI